MREVLAIKLPPLTQVLNHQIEITYTNNWNIFVYKIFLLTLVLESNSVSKKEHTFLKEKKSTLSLKSILNPSFLVFKRIPFPHPLADLMVLYLEIERQLDYTWSCKPDKTEKLIFHFKKAWVPADIFNLYLFTWNFCYALKWMLHSPIVWVLVLYYLLTLMDHRFSFF